MSITYPINTPTSIGIASIEISANNATATSRSPFSYTEQVLVYPGQMWSANITIPRQRKELVAPWVAFLTSLKGRQGTFLLGDPDYTSPQGTVSSCSLTGTSGSGSPTVVMTGSLLAGDYIQLGSGADSKLHKVLQDQTGDGTLEIWPNLRADYTSETVVTSSPKGVFRLGQNDVAYSIDNNSAYSISFSAGEVI